MGISTTLPPADLGSDTDLSLPSTTVVCLTQFHEVYALIWMPVPHHYQVDHLLTTEHNFKLN